MFCVFRAMRLGALRSAPLSFLLFVFFGVFGVHVSVGACNASVQDHRALR